MLLFVCMWMSDLWEATSSTTNARSGYSVPDWRDFDAVGGSGGSDWFSESLSPED